MSDQPALSGWTRSITAVAVVLVAGLAGFAMWREAQAPEPSPAAAAPTPEARATADAAGPDEEETHVHDHGAGVLTANRDLVEVRGRIAWAVVDADRFAISTGSDVRRVEHYLDAAGESGLRNIFGRTPTDEALAMAGELVPPAAFDRIAAQMAELGVAVREWRVVSVD